MEAKLSPIIAQYVTEKLLSIVFPKHNFNLLFLYKYVDDFVSVVPAISQVFNSCASHTQRAIERETYMSVPFLDTKITCTNSAHIILDLHHIPTSAGGYMIYMTNNGKMKKNFVLGMKYSIKSIYHPEFVVSNSRKLIAHNHDGSFQIKYGVLPYINYYII